MVRLLLHFSGVLERDWCRAMRGGETPGKNATSATTNEDENPDGEGIVGAGAAGSAGRRIENMGALLEQLAPAINWQSEVRVRFCAIKLIKIV